MDTRVEVKYMHGERVVGILKRETYLIEMWGGPRRAQWVLADEDSQHATLGAAQQDKKDWIEAFPGHVCRIVKETTYTEVVG